MFEVKQRNLDDLIRSDLIALANIKVSGNVDARVIEVINETTIKIDAEYTGEIGEYCVMADEIIKVVRFDNIADPVIEAGAESGVVYDEETPDTNMNRQSSSNNKSAILYIERAQKNTHISSHNLIGRHLRTVTLLEGDIMVISWEYEDSMGSVRNGLFPCDVSTGKINIKHKLKYWVESSAEKKYSLRLNKSMAYIFRGVGDDRYLKYTTVISKSTWNSKGKSDGDRISFVIKNVLSKIYDKNVAVNQQIKGAEIKEMLKIILQLPDDDIYYANGVTKDSFVTINNMHTKEYSKMSDLLKDLCNHGVRFCYDRLERVKIFSDMVVDNIVPVTNLKYSIIDTMMNSDSQLIYNSITVNGAERQTLYNFDDLNNQYVHFALKKENAIKADGLITIDKNGDYFVPPIIINDEDFTGHVQYGDYVLLKMKDSWGLEFYAQVITKDKNGTGIMPFWADKDRELLYYGKYKYLYSILNGNPTMLDLYYVRNELPMVFKYTVSYKSDGNLGAGTDNVDSRLMYPILPKVDGIVKYKNEKYLKFGCASNLKVGEYTNYSEDINGIYGEWNYNQLFYNRELTQFNGSPQNPPIFAMSNHMTMTKERLIEATTFNNKDLMLSIKKPDRVTKDCDAILNLYNEYNVNSKIDLKTDVEISRIGKKIIEVKSLEGYKVGDILIANRLENEGESDKREYDEVIKNIRWRVVAIEDQAQKDGTIKYYLWLDSNFAKPKDKTKKYTFTRFPVESIVYLQELYFRGNPVIQYKQESSGYVETSNKEGESSIDLYGEQKYTLDAKLTDRDGIKKLMGYILNNYTGLDKNTTKVTLPIKVFNELGLELMDVITVVDDVYTKVGEDMKWVILSEKSSSTTQVTDLTLFNINNSNTKAWDIDIDKVIEYNPVEIPSYSHTGGEGNTEKPNGGNGGTAVDKELGQFWLGEIDAKEFNAFIDYESNGYIYFKDFRGTKVDDYKTALFPESEFAIKVDGEVIFVQSDSLYRAIIRKRQVYDTEKTKISPNMPVTFFTCTTYVEPDGTFRARRMNVGSGSSYIKVHPITGVEIMGDFLIGDSNKHSGNALWEAFQKNRTFYSDTEPVNTPSYILRRGDIWINTSPADLNHPHCYDGNKWVSARDGKLVTALTNAKIFYQPLPPTDTPEYQIKENDIWYDTDDGNHPYIYQKRKWVSIRDESILTNTGNRIYYQPNPPTGTGLMQLKDGDIWIDSDEGNLQYVWTNNKWNDVRDKGILEALNNARVFFQDIAPISVIGGYQLKDNDIWVKTINGENSPHIYKNGVWELSRDNTIFTANNRIFFQPQPPHSTPEYTLRDNDTWYDTDEGNKPYVYKNGIWNTAQDQAIVQALGNAKIFYQPIPPVADMKEKDMWYDTDDGNHPYIYVGGQWISARDKVFETEGGNKIFFVPKMPPIIAGVSKENDMWFDTSDNNKIYVLVRGVDGVLSWVLANDSLDKINTGRVVINANTTFNGDATIVSTGTNETTVIKGGSITFTRGGVPITTFRNMRGGSVFTDGTGKGFVDFTDMNQNLIILPSLKGFDVTANVRSLNCRVEKDPTHLAENRYKFFVYGTEESFAGTIKVDSPNTFYSVVAYSAGVEGATISTIEKVITQLQPPSWGEFRNVQITGMSNQGIIAFRVSIDGAFFGEGHIPISTSEVRASGNRLYLNNRTIRGFFHNMSKTTKDKVEKNIRMEYYVKTQLSFNIKYEIWENRIEDGNVVGQDFKEYGYRTIQTNISNTDLRFVMGHYYYSPSFIENIVGGGEVQYIAIES